MKNKSASVVKVVALVILPLALGLAVVKAGQLRRARPQVFTIEYRPLQTLAAGRSDAARRGTAPGASAGRAGRRVGRAR
jgi:hypothetical protein